MDRRFSHSWRGDSNTPSNGYPDTHIDTHGNSSDKYSPSSPYPYQYTGGYTCHAYVDSHRYKNIHANSCAPSHLHSDTNTNIAVTSNKYTDLHKNIDTYRYSYSTSPDYRYADRDSHHYSYFHAHENVYAYQHIDSNVHSHVDKYTNIHEHTHGDEYTDPDADVDRHTYLYIYAYTDECPTCHHRLADHYVSQSRLGEYWWQLDL